MTRFLMRAVPALVLLAVAEPALGRFMRPDLEKVPVERLTANLEELLKKDAKDKQILFNLARLHAMAFAQKTDTAEVWKGKEANGAWFGFTPGVVPFKATKTDDAAKQKAAEEQLRKALARFDEVLKLAPNDLPAQLGRTWLLDVSGKRDEAVKGYRELIAEAWKTDATRPSLPLSGTTITIETAGYLIPLLDKEKDKDEIAALEGKVAQLKKLPRPITPVVVPLVDGATAADLEDRTARVRFDGDGTGLVREWSWITPHGAWLVHDPKRTGRVTSALQLFGGVTFWLFWDTGYDALRALDDNGDGELTGKELAGLALWHDANGNGVSDPGEVKPVGEHGIVALSCKHERDKAHPDNIAFSKAGVRFADGKARPTFDLILHGR